MHNTRKLAFSSVISAFSLLSIWASSVLQTGTLALLALSACFSAMVFYDCGTKYGFMHYFAVSLLAFLLVPKGAKLVAYIMFLGYYPYIRQKIKHISLRCIIFTIAFVLSFFLFKNLFLPGFELKAYHYILGILGGELLFFIFDYAIMCFGIFYKERFSFIKNNF